MPYVGLDCVVLEGGDTLFDKVDSGEIGFDQSVEHLTGTGGQDSTVYSMIEPKGNAETWLQSTMLLACVTKAAANGLPTVIATLDGGILAEDMKQQTDCYINSCKLSCEVGGAVKAAYDWLALGMTTSAVTVAPAAKANNLMLLWHGANVVIDTVTHSCQSWESTLENGLKLHTSLDGKTAGTQRMPEAITPGNQKVTLTAEFKALPTVDLLVDIPATVTFGFSAVNTEGSAKTFRHTVGALHPVSLPTKIVSGEGEVTWSMELEADYDDLDCWTYSLS